MRSAIAILLFGAWMQTATAQVRDTLTSTEVRSLRVGGGSIKDRFAPGIKVLGIDSITRLPYITDNLAVLLAGATTAAVKSYGFNSFATVSFRGASAAQSAVYWEGIPLMNGATGITDVSQLPVSVIDSISLNYGSSAALLGSGNVGGALMVHYARPEFGAYQSRGRLSGSIGSFGQYFGGGNVRVKLPRLFIAAGFTSMGAQNDFPVVGYSVPDFRTRNAQQDQQSATLTGAWKLNARNVLTGRLWLQTYDREIPRALFEQVSLKRQRDEDSRYMLHWERSGQHTRIYAKLAYLSSSFQYADSAIGLYTYLRSNHLFSEVGWSGPVGKQGQLLVFAPVQHFYLGQGGPTQTRIALASAYTRALAAERLKLGANIRAEAFDKQVVLLPGLNLSYQPTTQWRLRLNAQRSYRAPSLNELYYQPGGNSSLKPEQGWSYDGGYDYQYKRSGMPAFNHSLSAYQRHIKDWIIWLGGAIWTPHNLAAVRSTGIETENALSGQFRGISWRIGVNAAYTRSVSTQSYLAGDNSIGCQIPYVPQLSGTSIAGIGYNKFYFEWASTYTGRRYTTTDESAYLPHYWLCNARLRYAPVVLHMPFIFQISVNNVFDTPYTVVAYRPMPGVNYLLSVSFSVDEL